MDAGSVLRTLYVMRSDSLYKNAVLVHRFDKTTGIAHRTATNGGHLLTQIVDDAAQTLVAAGRIKNIVEGSVDCDDFVHIVVGNVLADFQQVAVQRLQLLVGDALSGKACGENIQADADFINLGDILDRNISNIGAAARNHHDEALLLQLTDSLAHGGTADAHFVSELNFHQAFAWTEGAVDDGLADIFTHQLT